jgi:hypothetical protein
MMHVIRALMLLELALLRNNLRAVLRSPLRLTLWSLYLGALLVAGFLRMHTSLKTQAAPSLLSPELARAFGGTYLAMLGGTFVYHALGNVRAFRSSAEAMLFRTSGISSRMTVIWLQICKLLLILSRWLWTIILNFIIFLPNHVARAELLHTFLTSIAGAALLIALEIPAFLLGKRKGALILIVAGTCITVLGALHMLAGLASTTGNADIKTLTGFLPLNPSGVVISMIDGPPIALICFLLLSPLVSLSVLYLGADAIPELYAASTRSFETIRRNRSAIMGAVFKQNRTKSSPGWIPSGAWVLLWKDWLAFRRRRWACVIWSLLLTMSISLGSSMAALARTTHHESDGWSLLGIIISFVFIVPLFASIGLADDVGKPLFWMTTRSLRQQLCVWTIGRSWRGGTIVSAALLVAALGMGDTNAAVIVTPASMILWFSLNAIGVALYAFFPHRMEGHGPLFLIRMIAATTLLLPCLIVSLLTLVMTQSAHLAMVLACIMLTAESLGSLELAARRLRQNGAAFALMERAG